MVLWPAASWISFNEAPFIASHEQKVWRFECQTQPEISASSRHGLNQLRVEKIGKAVCKDPVARSLSRPLYGLDSSHSIGIEMYRPGVPVKLHNTFKSVTAAAGENMTDVLLEFIEDYVRRHSTAASKPKGRRS